MIENKQAIVIFVCGLLLYVSKLISCHQSCLEKTWGQPHISTVLPCPYPQTRTSTESFQSVMASPSLLFLRMIRCDCSMQIHCSLHMGNLSPRLTMGWRAWSAWVPIPIAYWPLAEMQRYAAGIHGQGAQPLNLTTVNWFLVYLTAYSAKEEIVRHSSCLSMKSCNMDIVTGTELTHSHAAVSIWWGSFHKIKGFHG